jgi:CheY-like chemotaxis protein
VDSRVDSRDAVLVVVDDPSLLDLWTQVLEGARFTVATAATARQAIAALESGRGFDVVVAVWDGEHALGADVYRWALKHMTALRAQFVFVGDDVGADFDRVVGGRCLAVRADDLDELVRVVTATARRHEHLERLGQHDLVFLDGDRPPLLLVDADPAQLMVMTALLGDVGFLVTPVESGNAAIAKLEHEEFDVVISEWHMPDGGGIDLYRWLCTMRPWLLDRLIVLTGGDVAEATASAIGVPVLPKGQDSAVLLSVISEATRRTRGVVAAAYRE